MIKRTALLAIAHVLVLSFAVHAGDLTKEDVNDVVKKISAGKMVDINQTYPPEQTQVVWISMPSFQYMIDVRAKMCFIHAFGTSIAPVSCKALKTGYPLIAPIIDWE